MCDDGLDFEVSIRHQGLHQRRRRAHTRDQRCAQRADSRAQAGRSSCPLQSCSKHASRPRQENSAAVRNLGVKVCPHEAANHSLTPEAALRVEDQGLVNAFDGSPAAEAVARHSMDMTGEGGLAPHVNERLPHQRRGPPGVLSPRRVQVLLPRSRGRGLTHGGIPQPESAHHTLTSLRSKTSHALRGCIRTVHLRPWQASPHVDTNHVAVPAWM